MTILVSFWALLCFILAAFSAGLIASLWLEMRWLKRLRALHEPPCHDERDVPREQP